VAQFVRASVVVAVVFNSYRGAATFAGAFGYAGVTAEAVFDRQRNVLVDRARMGFLFLNSEVWQQVQDYIRFYFQLPRQLVNSDLQLHRMVYCVRTVVRYSFSAQGKEDMSPFSQPGPRSSV